MIRYGTSDINRISIGIPIWYMGYQFSRRYIDVAIYHIDMVILDIDVGYVLLIWEMTVSIWSSSLSIWELFSLCKPLVAGMVTEGIECLRQELTLAHFSAQPKSHLKLIPA